VTVLDTTGRTVEQSTADLRGWVAAARAGRVRVPRGWAAGLGT
jgi:hypothetical protein